MIYLVDTVIFLIIAAILGLNSSGRMKLSWKRLSRKIAAAVIVFAVIYNAIPYIDVYAATPYYVQDLIKGTDSLKNLTMNADKFVTFNIIPGDLPFRDSEYEINEIRFDTPTSFITNYKYKITLQSINKNIFAIFVEIEQTRSRFFSGLGIDIPSEIGLSPMIDPSYCRRKCRG